MFCSIDNTTMFNYTQRMKKLPILTLIFLYPVLSDAHPGKTDNYGGHMCLKECEEWKLFYKEYHLHDKDWKPIRIGKKRKGKAPAPVMSGPSSLPEETAVKADQLATAVVTTYHYVTNVYEENLFSSTPLLYILLILLLLLLILRMNRRRGDAEENKP